MHTVRSYSSNGPYFAATRDIYNAASLRQLIFHTRQCMEDNEYQIGIFNENNECIGMWLDEAEPIPDGEGGMVLEKPCYSLYRPGDISAGMWNLHLRHFKQLPSHA